MLVICDSAGFMATLFYAVMIAFYVGICLYFVTCNSDLTLKFKHVDDMVNVCGKDLLFKQKITKCLIEFIEFHQWNMRLV